MEWYCYLRNVQDLLADGKTHYERQFGEHSKGQYFLLGPWLNITRFQHEINQDFIKFDKKVLPGMFLVYAKNAGIWKRRSGRRH